MKHALPSILRAMQYKLLHIDNTYEDFLGESVNAAIAIAKSIQFISVRLVCILHQTGLAIFFTL